MSALYDRLWDALDEVYEGRLEPRRAQAMASLALVMLRVADHGEFEERLANIERQARAGAS